MTQHHRQHRVRFEGKARVSDGKGGFTETWSEITTEWCEIERVQSFRFDVERMSAGSQASMPTVRIHVDKHAATATINHTHRVVEVFPSLGKVYNVNFVQDLEGRNRYLVVTATEDQPV